MLDASTAPQPATPTPGPLWRRWRTSAPWLLLALILLLTVAIGQPARVRWVAMLAIVAAVVLPVWPHLASS